MQTHMGFPPTYTDALSPQERGIFIHFFEEDEKKRKRAEGPSGENNSSIGSPMDYLGNK